MRWRTKRASRSPDRASAHPDRDEACGSKGCTEGWGSDYHDYMGVWERITNPIPIPDFEPRGLDDCIDYLDRLWLDFHRLRDRNEAAAAALNPWVTAHAKRVLQLVGLHR